MWAVDLGQKQFLYSSLVNETISYKCLECTGFIVCGHRVVASFAVTSNIDSIVFPYFVFIIEKQQSFFPD